jgi:hypothetical protein
LSVHPLAAEVGDAEAATAVARRQTVIVSGLREMGKNFLLILLLIFTAHPMCSKKKEG